MNLWTRGFPPKNDKHPRYTARNGMRNLVAYLANGLRVEFDTKVESIKELESEFVVVANGKEYRSDIVVLTQPMPQAVDLAKEVLSSSEYDKLKKISYYPCITLLFNSEESISECGAYQYKGEVVDFICDNKIKGISNEHIFTLHCSPTFSEAHFDEPKEAIISKVQKELATFSNIQVKEPQVKMWRYAQPKTPFDEKCLIIENGHKKIIFAGDQFAGSKIEGAVLSALDVVSRLSK